MFKYPIAVTIDTNIFDAAKYDLSEGSTLRLLKNYVDKGLIKVVLSNIVVRESKKHIAKQVKKVCSIARKLRTEVLQESTEHLVNYIGLNRLLEISKDKDTLVKKSEELFDDFTHEINAEILGTDLINLERIIDDYFEINPPFEEGEKKRKEFPDAFIADQIKKRFGETEDVVIVSNDEGFKKACCQTKNHIFFNSLGELFDSLNKEDAAYTETMNQIKELQFRISAAVLEYIKLNENIDVRGLSYDKDGIVSGFDYDEFYLNNISDITFRVHSVDEISKDTSKVTLLCNANISVDCYYEDYENAPWDSETKDYLFVENIQMREEHCAYFGCRIDLERATKSFKILPFTIILGGDSRKDRYEIKGNSVDNYEQEIHDMDREYLGFIPLGSYESYLEDALPDSELSSEILERFETVNELHRKFEDFCNIYDLLLDELNNSNSQKTIKSIYENLSDISDIPHIVNVDNIKDSEVEEIKKWLNDKYEKASEISEEDSLTDTLNYGESVVIKGIDGSELIFTIDEIKICPIEGNEEFININLTNNQGDKIGGYVKLLVGYLDFDEDGGVSDGANDEIEYEFDEIIKELDCFIIEQNQLAEKEAKIVEIIESALNS
ncbi:MAG: DUF4935 domain-containing protein [Ruminococcaceae bacterium]|nr:DUF4935 domain-containing protein [Oscillospiraceae bacterium]